VGARTGAGAVGGIRGMDIAAGAVFVFIGAPSSWKKSFYSNTIKPLSFRFFNWSTV
jgi:hypothetical protein